MRRPALVALLLAASAGLGGCSGDDRSPLDTVQGAWRLNTMTVDGQVYLLDSPVRLLPTLDVAGDQVSGSSGCNQFGAEVAEDGDQLTIVLGYSTMIGCPGSRGEIEAAYFEGLAAVTTAERDGSDLVLSGDDVSLTFLAADEDGAAR